MPESPMAAVCNNLYQLQNSEAHMDYRVLAQEELKSLPMLASASANTAAELEEIKLKLRSAKNAKIFYEEACKGAHAGDERMLALKSQKDELQLRLRETRLRMNRIGRALDVLSDEERHLLTECYVVRENTPEDIMEVIGVEKSSFYRMRGEALERFTRAMFGVVLT